LRRLTGGPAEFWVELYVASAFGIGWGLAYFVDHPEWSLPKKMGISFIGIVFWLLSDCYVSILKLQFLRLSSSLRFS
jgi:hypothetical protein